MLSKVILGYRNNNPNKWLKNIAAVFGNDNSQCFSDFGL